ncbi:MAG: glycosyltransferase family 4 protein [Nitrososphaeria archaeon]
MKVDLVNDHPEGTGIYSYIREIYSNLVEHGIDVKLYDFGNRGLLHSLLLPRITRLKVSDSIVHLSNPNLGFMARGAIVTVHDLYYLHYVSNSRAWSWYCKRNYGSIGRARMVIANSSSTESEVRKELGVERVKVVHPSIGREFRVEGERADPWPGKRVLVHVGYDMPNKNIGAILRALKILPENYVLVRIGRDNESTQKAVMEAGLKSRYRNIRVKGSAELAAVYRGSHAMVFPSLYEGFGIPPVEAMACGLPVVSSDRNGLKESVGGAAVVIDPEEPASIADAVLSLDDSELYRKLRAAGIKNASKFSHENQFRQLMSAYAVEF